MKSSLWIITCLCAFTMSAQTTKKTINIFNNATINTQSKLNMGDESVSDNNNETINLSNGTIVLRKIVLPTYKKDVKIKAKLTLKSAGDPWSRIVSCFIIPKGSAIDFVEIQNGGQELPPFNNKKEKIPGIVPDQGYWPCVELLRTATPFGIGYYSDSLQNRKPVYIPFWEKQITWEADITELSTELEGEVSIGIKIDNANNGGFKTTLDLEFKENSNLFSTKPKYWIMPIINTVPYIKQNHVDVFSRQDIEAIVDIPQGIKNVRLRYIVSGHGGHIGGDEFTKQENIIDINGKEIYRSTPWRDDCAAFRRFNPHAGVWTEKTIWKGQEIEERIASSDYSRSGWCPGSDITPVEIPIKSLLPGKNSIRFSIPKAQKNAGKNENYWLISAYLIGEM